MTVDPNLAGLAELRRVTDGDPRVCVAILDGPVDLSHACFQGANLSAGRGPLPRKAPSGAAAKHGTHVASIVFGGGAVHGISPGCRGITIPIFDDDETGT